MKKLFISQPMRDKTDEEILIEREKAVKVAKEILNEDVEVIDSFFQEAPHDANPLWYLAKSLELLATADVAFFCNDWEKYRGCKIEYTCAVEYGIRVIRKWDTKLQSITLTQKEWSSIETYLMFTEEHFKKTIGVWEELSKQKDFEGNSKYPVATKNVKLLRGAKQDAERLLLNIKELE